MLFWISISIFSFSIGLILNNSIKKNNERKLKLRSIQRKIEAKEKAKAAKIEEENLNDVQRKIKEFKQK